MYSETAPPPPAPKKRRRLTVQTLVLMEDRGPRSAIPAERLDSQGDYEARKNLPAGFRSPDLKLRHQDPRYTCWDDLPDIRSYNYDIKQRGLVQEQERVRGHIGRLGGRARTLEVFDLLGKYSREYQLTIPRLVEQFNLRQPNNPITQRGFRTAFGALLRAGLAEVIPVKARDGKAAGTHVRLRRKEQWPRPFNVVGPDKAALFARPNWNPHQGREMPSTTIGRSTRQSSRLHQFMLDCFTGEVIEIATGAVLFSFQHGEVRRWGANVFLRRLRASRGSKVSSPCRGLYCTDAKGEFIQNSPYPSKEGNRDQGPVPPFSNTRNSSPCLSPWSSIPAESLTDLMDSEEVDPDSPEEFATIPHPDSPLPAHVLEEDVPEIQQIQAEWKARELPLENAFPDPETRPTDPRFGSLYDTLHNGQMVISALRAPHVHVEYYRTSHYFTDTDVHRWYCNSPEGRLLGNLIGDEARENIWFAKYWMRRLSSAVRKDRTGRIKGRKADRVDRLYGTFVRLDLLRLAISRSSEIHKTFNPHNLLSPQKFLRSFTNGSTSVAMMQEYCRRQTCADAIDDLFASPEALATAQAKFNTEVEAAKQQFLADTYEHWTPVTFDSSGKKKVDWHPCHLRTFLVTMMGAAQAGREADNNAYLYKLLTDVPTDWINMALHDTIAGQLVIRFFVEGCRGLYNPESEHNYAFHASGEVFFKMFWVRLNEIGADADAREAAEHLLHMKVNRRTQNIMWLY